MLHVKSNLIIGCNIYHSNDNVLTDISNDSFHYSHVDSSEPLKFNDQSFEGLDTCTEVEALKLPLMVMLGPHDLDKGHKKDLT